MLVTFDLPGFNEHDPDEKTLDKFPDASTAYSPDLTAPYFFLGVTSSRKCSKKTLQEPENS